MTNSDPKENETDESPQIVVDSDWKEQVAKEKETLANQTATESSSDSVAETKEAAGQFRSLGFNVVHSGDELTGPNPHARPRRRPCRQTNGETFHRHARSAVGKDQRQLVRRRIEDVDRSHARVEDGLRQHTRLE